MEIPTTLVLAIGADTYKSAAFDPLPGAKVDTDRIVDLFLSRGLPLGNITALNGPDATRSACLDAIRLWPARVAPAGVRLFLFYSGHGATIDEPGLGPVDVLATFDADSSDATATGLPLADISSAMKRTRPLDAFVFVDACEVGISSQTLGQEAVTLAHVAERTALAMFAAPGRRAHESREPYGGGIFTRSVLDALSVRNPWSSAMIADRVARDLGRAEQPPPHVHLRGTPTVVPMDGLEKPAHVPALSDADWVTRVDALTDLVESADGPWPVWIFGPHGSGKTTLIKQLVARSGVQCVAVSAPSSRSQADLDVEAVGRFLAGRICEALPDLFPDGRPPLDELAGTLRSIADARPDLSVVLDQMDHLPTLTRHEVIAAAVAVLGSRVVLVSVDPPPHSMTFQPFVMPPLTNDEVTDFIDRYGDADLDASADLLRIETRGNPLRLRSLLSQRHEVTDDWLARTVNEEERRTISFIAASDGFRDSALFCEITELSEEACAGLMSRGLVVRSGDRFVAHDSSLRLARIELEMTSAAARYWIAELDRAGSLPFASLRLARLLLDDERLDASALAALPAVARDLFLLRDWGAIEGLAAAVRASDEKDHGTWPAAALSISGLLAKTARHQQAGELLDAIRGRAGLSVEEVSALNVLDSERHWWYGDFDAAVRIATAALDSAQRPEALLSRGIAQWFSGSWSEADRDLTECIAASESDARTLGWAYVMLASSYGLRGKEFGQVKEWFYRGTSMLTLVGDDMGSAVGWNNFGEISWKHGDFAAAEVQLARAVRHAEGVGGATLVVEVLRSFIEIALRQHGPWSAEVNQAILEVEGHYDASMGPMVNMQLWNTLATVASLRGEHTRAEELVERLIPVTRGNPEYHIYTLGNAGMIALLARADAEAREEYAEAARLCREHGNPLAARQLAGLLQIWFEHHRSDDTATRDELIQLFVA